MSVTFDRNQFVKSLWQAKLARRITPTSYLIGRAMLRRASRAGQCWPSMDTIAADVGCCVRTVARAVSALRLVGLLSWVQRRVGWNRRTSNLYALAPPKEEKKTCFESSAAKMSGGSIPVPVAAALARLGALLGVPDSMVLPGLAG